MANPCGNSPTSAFASSAHAFSVELLRVNRPNGREPVCCVPVERQKATCLCRGPPYNSLQVKYKSDLDFQERTIVTEASNLALPSSSLKMRDLRDECAVLSGSLRSTR